MELAYNLGISPKNLISLMNLKSNGIQIDDESIADS
jgi:hypothetical protein